MTISFVGGRYDGLLLDPMQIEQSTELLILQSRNGPRSFLILSDATDWSRFGIKPRELAPFTKQRHCYGLESTPERVVARYDQDVTIFYRSVQGERPELLTSEE